MVKKIRLILLFYRNFSFASLVITLACTAIFWEYGYSIFGPLLWFKLACMYIIFRFVKSYKAKEFYYYQNLGVSKQLLWTMTLSFDLILFILFILQANRFR